jgi:HTH-type transcriptional regulator, transcriptional repressor of NAD biosynthesis genes
LEKIIKICFYGPESVGKSGLAIQFAEMFQTNFVLEQARNFIVTNDFSVAEIIQIGRAQNKAVVEAEKVSNKILFCDTDLITTQIYSKYYLNQIPQVLFELEKELKYDLYFLLDIDIEWVADGLRDLGHKRKEMYEIFENELLKRNIAYIKVFGPWQNRVKIVEKALMEKFDLSPKIKLETDC